MKEKELFVGVDIGSTTVKIAITDREGDSLYHHRYVRHNAEQAATVLSLLEEAHERYPGIPFRVALCGSGSIEIARVIEAFYIQEVVATGLVVKHFHPKTRTAIELGGQDAKLIFFEKDRGSGKTLVNDMRMNGSCAGGTGAFIDQVAELLNIVPEQFDRLAAEATRQYEISGRCGVFAKTDIQPLLNQGVPKEDIALSSLHAIAKQTIGGLAQGLRVTGPVIFVGGPLTFNPTLIRVFAERLHLDQSEILVPEHPEIFVARGAAASIREMYDDAENRYRPENLERLRRYLTGNRNHNGKAVQRFFNSPQEHEDFRRNFALPVFQPHYQINGNLQHIPFGRDGNRVLEVYLGLDAGSTTSKFVLLDEEGNLVDKYYSRNEGDPLTIIKNGLLRMRKKYTDLGIELRILGAGSTGYGEKLFARAFKLDYSMVETVAHTRAALEESPRVSFILDIGGQDMKAIFVDRGMPVNFVLNEACSSGCGSFLETYASALQIETEEIAGLAFQSQNASRLGSRCTVFMNSSIITEQKNGRSLSDIFAGLCNSVVENALTKVLRIPSIDVLGDHVIVQGGTFKNDAVLRAFQQKLGKAVIRPPHPGEMGAIGIALLTREQMQNCGSDSLFSWELVEKFSYRNLPALTCSFCSNNCVRSVVEFSHGDKYVAGNRCERGEILDDPKNKSVKEQLKEVNARIRSVPDLSAFRSRLLVRDFEYEQVDADRDVTIGIPRILEFWDSLPFWKTFFQSLGYRVQVSAPSSYTMFEDGLGSVSSDTICLPAKMAHGHVRELILRKPDRIFNPMMLKGLNQNEEAANSWMCPVIQGYSEIIRIHDNPEKYHGIAFDRPPFQFDSSRSRNRQIVRYACRTLGLKKKVVLRAIEQADRVLRTFQETLVAEGERVLASLEGTENFAVIMAGRPYHNDGFINHDLSKHFTRLGIPVLDLDCLPGLSQVDLSDVMVETNNLFHTRLFAAGIIAARHPRLELVQIVSFGCGHDAILSDELIRIMDVEGGKIPLILKLDEGENRGPVGIRVRSFVETVKNQRRRREQIAGKVSG